jgi:hypothetical protein
MMSALDYGNANAYFFGNANFQTAFMVGVDTEDGNLSWSRVTYYSIIRDSSVIPPTAATPTQRLTGAAGLGGAAIVGRQGPRPVAFPLTEGWNFDQPATT